MEIKAQLAEYGADLDLLTGSIISPLGRQTSVTIELKNGRAVASSDGHKLWSGVYVGRFVEDFWFWTKV